jgi:beta-lactamase regulating signal transducer with metallopeptidase domain
MTHFADWLSPATLRLLALALLHFLWQGAALAALAYVLMALCRSAATRYAIAVAMLILMVSAPATTFLVLRTDEKAEAPASMAEGVVISPGQAVSFAPAAAIPRSTPREATPAYFLWLVEAWFAGVMLLSLRSAGGFLLVARLRRRESTPVHEELLKLCLSLQRRMGLTRVVRYCQCIHLDAPAVAGWVRPVVFLPMTALTGLSAAQLEAVIAHELAHIRRFDAFVNLFQIAVETLLFYHPAVWWLGKQIRAERENCCDDEAVALCGSPVNYAKALAHMAEWQAAPRLVMAANRGLLSARVARLLGANESAGTFRRASLSAGVLCLSAALLAGSAFVGGAHNVHAQSTAQVLTRLSAATPSPIPAPARKPHPTPVWDTAVLVLAPNASSVQETNPAPSPQPAPAQQPESSGKASYIDAMKVAGLTNLTVDQLVGMKIQGVTPEYVKSMKDLGLKIDPDTLIGMKVQGITPSYVAQMRTATGQSLDADDLIGLKVQGVTPDYIKEIHDLGFKADADDIIGMKVQGVTPDYIREMRSLDLKVDSDDVISMKVQGITPEYVKSIHALGLHPSADELVGMKVQGITADYLKELQAAGFKMNIDEAIGAKVQGITPEFIKQARSHGFKDLTLDQLISLKRTGVLDPEK